MSAPTTSITTTPQTTQNTLPETHKALILTSVTAPLTLSSIPTPKPHSGSITVRILLTNILTYATDVFQHSSSTSPRHYPFPTPFIPGGSAIARVAALGPDSAALSPGDIVLVDSFIVGRDDPSSHFIFGLHSGATEGSRKLMSDVWRNATYAEYARVPLENCVRVPTGLLGSTGVGEESVDWPALERLAALPKLSVPYGGLVDVGLRVGETCIIAPATGYFGGAAVEIALAMGAQVVAAGRNGEALEKLAGSVDSPRLRTVMLTGDVVADARALGPADVWQDWSPPGAAQSAHLKACLLALRVGGRASLMGGIQGDVSLPFGLIVRNNLALKGKWMYESDAPLKVLQLAEAGLLQLKKKEVKTFQLEEWTEAFEHAKAHPGWDSETLFKP